MTETYQAIDQFQELVRDAMNFEVSVNTGNFQSLFEDLFSNLTKMQNQIDHLNKDIATRATKEEMTDAVNQVQITVDADNRQIQKLQNTIEDIKDEIDSKFQRANQYCNTCIEKNNESLLERFNVDDKSPFSSFEPPESEIKPVVAPKVSLQIEKDAKDLLENLPEERKKTPIVAEEKPKTPAKEAEEKPKTPVKEEEKPKTPAKEVEPVPKESLAIEIPKQAETKPKHSSRKASSRKASSRSQKKPEDRQEYNDIMRKIAELEFTINNYSSDLTLLMDKQEQMTEDQKKGTETIDGLEEAVSQLNYKSIEQEKQLEDLTRKLSETEKGIESQFNDSNEKFENFNEEIMVKVKDLVAKLPVPEKEVIVTKEIIQQKAPTPKAEQRAPEPQKAPSPKVEERKKTPEEIKPQTVQTPAAASKEETEDVKRLKQQQREMMDMIKTQQADLDPTDILKQVLEAAKYEIELMGRQAVDKSNQTIKKYVDSLEKDIQTTNGNVQELVKNLDDKMYKLNQKTVEDITKQLSSNSKDTNDLKLQGDTLNKQIETLRQQIKSMSATSQLDETIKNIKSNADGTIDITPILSQLSVINKATKEIVSRVEFLEQAEVVQPSSFKEVCEALGAYDEKFSGIESNFVLLEMKIGTMGDRISELKSHNRDEVDERKFIQLRELIASVEEEMKAHGESIKQLIQGSTDNKLEINETKQSIQETNKRVTKVSESAASLKEAQSALGGMVKKVDARLSNTKDEIAEQITLLTATTRVNASSIESIRNHIQTHANAPQQTIQLSPSKQTSEENLRPNTKTSGRAEETVKSEHASRHESKVAPTVTKEDIATSPRVQEEKSALPKLKKDKDRSKSRNTEGRNAIFESRRIEEIAQKVQTLEVSVNGTKSSIDTILKQCKMLAENKADKDALQNLFDQFKSAFSEMNNRIGAVRRSINTKVEMSELAQFRKEVIMNIQSKGETAAGTENIRCLLCGQIRKGVTGASHGITQPTPSQSTQSTYPRYTEEQTLKFSDVPVLSSSVTDNSGEGAACLVYSKDGEMFKGRSLEKQRIVPAEGPIIPTDLIDDTPAPEM